jgi:hypothetical protein
MELVVVQVVAEILPALVEQAIVRLEVLLKEMQEDRHLVDQVRRDLAGAGVVLEQLETDQTVMAGQELQTTYLVLLFFTLVVAVVEHTTEVLRELVVLALEVLVVLQLRQIIPAQTEQMVVEAVAVAVQFLVVDKQTAATAVLA